MEKSKEEEIKAYILNGSDVLKDVLLLRLYEDYITYKDVPSNKKDISLAKYKNAENIINSKIKHIEEDSDYYYNCQVIDDIKKKQLVFNNSMIKFSLKDKDKLRRIEEMITILESYLKLPITFNDRIENCLEHETDKRKR